MALRFAYRTVRTTHALVTLGGRSVRLRPIVDLTVIGPTGSTFRRALLDTGADEVVMPDMDASVLGIDLSRAPANTMAGVGSPPYSVRYAPVRLRLTDGVEYHEWPALIGFTPALTNRALFGFTGGLEFFTSTFHGDRAEVELAINSAYPGT